MSDFDFDWPDPDAMKAARYLVVGFWGAMAVLVLGAWFAFWWWA